MRTPCSVATTFVDARENDAPVFCFQHVGYLAAEAMSLVEADGGAEVGEDCSHPLLEAKTPRELALLVKHYRLLQVRLSQGHSIFIPSWYFLVSPLRGVEGAVDGIEAGKSQRAAELF